jgi:predicted CoA-substrate-specific enzyme activase
VVRVGIDVGSLYTKGLVISEDRRVLARAVEATTTDVPGLTQSMLADLLTRAGIALEEVRGVASTGQGRRRVPFADVYKTDFTAFAWGAKLLHDPVRMVIDAGGQGVRIIEMDEWGMMTNFRTNDKCSSGTGCFLDTMAYALEVELADMGDVGRASLCAASINSSCTVFAESEVVSAVAKGESKMDIISGLNQMVAKRMASLAKTLAVRGDVVFVGGVGRNRQVVELLRQRFNHRVVVPDDPHMVGALGAAVLAPHQRKDMGVGT